MNNIQKSAMPRVLSNYKSIQFHEKRCNNKMKDKILGPPNF